MLQRLCELKEPELCKAGNCEVMILLIDCLCRNLKWMWIDYFFSISAQTERRIWKSGRLWPSPQIWEILQNWWTLMVRCFPYVLFFVCFFTFVRHFRLSACGHVNLRMIVCIFVVWTHVYKVSPAVMTDVGLPLLCSAGEVICVEWEHAVCVLADHLS